MVRKRYEVRGMMEWHTVFKAGRSRLQVSFTGGHLCGGASTPASFETADPVVQAVIEGSKAFKSGRITIGMVMGKLAPSGAHADGCEAVAPYKDARADGCEAEAPYSVMEFKDKGKAADFLQFEKGLPIEKLLTIENCVAEARQLGIDLRINKDMKS